MVIMMFHKRNYIEAIQPINRMAVINRTTQKYFYMTQAKPSDKILKPIDSHHINKKNTFSGVA